MGKMLMQTIKEEAKQSGTEWAAVPNAHLLDSGWPSRATNLYMVPVEYKDCTALSIRPPMPTR